MILRTGKKGPKDNKRNETRRRSASIILMAMRVQCNAKMIGLMSMVNEHCITSVE